MVGWARTKWSIDKTPVKLYGSACSLPSVIGDGFLVAFSLTLLPTIGTPSVSLKATQCEILFYFFIFYFLFFLGGGGGGYGGTEMEGKNGMLSYH